MVIPNFDYYDDGSMPEVSNPCFKNILYNVRGLFEGLSFQPQLLEREKNSTTRVSAFCQRVLQIQQEHQMPVAIKFD
jgi:hypothetical protein